MPVNTRKNNLRRSSRKRIISSKLKRSLSNPGNDCHFLWDTKKGDFINNFNKNKFFCRTNRSGKKMFYKKNNKKKEYKFVGYQNKIDRCIGLANVYNTEKITEEELCDSEKNDINNFVNVDKYLKSLFTKPKVESFFKDLMEIIFINTQNTDLNYQEILDAILSGAYCIFSNDKGEVFSSLFNKYKSTIFKNASHGPGGSDGFSSHYSHKDHYRLGVGKLYDTKDRVSNRFDFLIGRRPIINKWQYKNKSVMSKFYDYQGDTWMQFESFRMGGPVNFLGHAASAAEYFLHRKQKNIGPYGKSSYTEMGTPLILNLCKKNSSIKRCKIRVSK